MTMLSELQFSLPKIILLFFLLCISAFASSSETAFFSLNRFQMRRLRDRFHNSYERVRTLLSRPNRLLVLILLMNECVNLTFSSLITEWFEENQTAILPRLGSFMEAHSALSIALCSIATTLPILLFFGEIPPKVIAAKMNRLVVMSNSPILLFFSRLFYPILWFLDSTVEFLLTNFSAQGKKPLEKTSGVLSEDDVVMLMEEGHLEGTVFTEERRWIKRVLELDNTRAQDIMTPITESFCVSSEVPVGDLLPEIRNEKFSRIPVFQKTKRNIVGILYVKDLLSIQNQPEHKELEVKQLMANPFFIHPEMRLSQLFRKLKDAKTHMAICVDHSDQAVGVITMEDVLESIFGEIADERDVS